MENFVMKNRTIQGTVRRPGLNEKKFYKTALMREDSFQWIHVLEKTAQFIPSIISVLVLRKIDRSYYERARRGLYY